MGKVSGIRAVLALREALDRQGLKRTSTMNGGAITGWVDRNHSGSTGFSIRPLENGRLDWHLVISGKPHMRYRSYKDIQGDEVYELHEPVNPEVIYPKIRAAFADLGIVAEEVRESGWQTMWDDDVDYNVATAVPKWLAEWDPENREPIRPAAPLLLSAKLERDNRFFPIAVKTAIPVYEIAEGLYAATRQGAYQIVAEAAGLVSDRWVKYGTAAIDPDGSLVIGSDGNKSAIAPVQITNYWGDKVDVYPLPGRVAMPQWKYASPIEVVVGGEWIVPGFAVLDGQYGGAPWNGESVGSAPCP